MVTIKPLEIGDKVYGYINDGNEIVLDIIGYYYEPDPQIYTISITTDLRDFVNFQVKIPLGWNKIFIQELGRKEITDNAIELTKEEFWSNFKIL